MNKLSLFALPIVATCSVAVAQDGASKQWSRCREEHVDPQARIQACSALLGEDYVPSETRAIFLSNRASAYSDAGSVDKSIADYDAALKLEPELAEALNGRCWVRAVDGRELKVALKDCDAALDVVPNDADELDSRGLVHLRLREWRKAIADYSAALEKKPTEASSLFGRGIARVASGDKAGGEADIVRAKSFDASIADRFAAMGVVP